MRLKDKIAIITGVSQGIGRATAFLFAQEGAIVIGADVDVEGGREVEDLIRQSGGEIEFIEADVSEYSDVKRVLDRAMDYGSINVLFNNAGIEVVKPLVDTSEEEWDRTMSVNLKSVYLCCSLVIPEMIKNDGGTIVNNSSAAGLVGSFSAAYSASKGGIIALTKALAVEVAQFNIRVNCVCPGAIETPMLWRVMEKQGDPNIVREERLRAYPLDRFGETNEVAQAVLFLSSDEASFITGSILPVDGGFTAR